MLNEVTKWFLKKEKKPKEEKKTETKNDEDDEFGILGIEDAVSSEEDESEREKQNQMKAK